MLTLDSSAGEVMRDYFKRNPCPTVEQMSFRDVKESYDICRTRSEGRRQIRARFDALDFDFAIEDIRKAFAEAVKKLESRPKEDLECWPKEGLEDSNPTPTSNSNTTKAV